MVMSHQCWVLKCMSVHGQSEVQGTGLVAPEEEGGGLPPLSHHRARAVLALHAGTRDVLMAGRGLLAGLRGVPRKALTPWHSPGCGILALCLQGIVGAADGFPGRVFLCSVTNRWLRRPGYGP